MKNLLPLLQFCLSILIINGCKKQSHPPELPPITQEGLNTFGCKINGEVWVPYYPCSIYSTGTPEISYGFPSVSNLSALPIYFGIAVGNTRNDHTSFSITLRSNNSYIYSGGNIIDSLIIHFSGNSTKNYYTSKGMSTPSFFQITKLDTLHKIISGVFSFTMYTNSPTAAGRDSIVVSDGRFDLQLIPVFFRCTQ